LARVAVPEVKVATLNLHNRQDRWLARRGLIVAELLDHLPELISLQEMAMPIGQGRWLKNQLNHRLAGESSGPYRLVQKRRLHPLNGYLEGIGILSTLPILSHDWLSLGYGGRVALRANVELPDRQMLDFVAVHLHQVDVEQEARMEQVMRLTGWLHGTTATPLQVIAGDFNEVPDGPAIRWLKQRYRSAFEVAWGHEPLATFPTALARPDRVWAGCLDYIFLSPAVGRTVRVEVFCRRPDAADPTLYPSDHVGLIATLDTAVGGRDVSRR
jgi:endonuclease/exonuclease/phosphatase family metal-dependent hydrolase